MVLQTGQSTSGILDIALSGQSEARWSGLPQIKHDGLLLVASADSQVAMSSGSVSDHFNEELDDNFSRNCESYKNRLLAPV